MTPINNTIAPAGVDPLVSEIQKEDVVKEIFLSSFTSVQIHPIQQKSLEERINNFSDIIISPKFITYFSSFYIHFKLFIALKNVYKDKTINAFEGVMLFCVSSIIINIFAFIFYKKATSTTGAENQGTLSQNKQLLAFSTNKLPANPNSAQVIKKIQENQWCKKNKCEIKICLDLDKHPKIEDAIDHLSCELVSKPSSSRLGSLLGRTPQDNHFTHVEIPAERAFNALKEDLDLVKNIAKETFRREIRALQREQYKKNSSQKTEVVVAQMQAYQGQSSVNLETHLSETSKATPKLKTKKQQEDKKPVNSIEAKPTEKVQQNQIVEFENQEEEGAFEDWLSEQPIGAQKTIKQALKEFPKGGSVQRYAGTHIWRIYTRSGSRVYILKSPDKRFICVRWGDKKKQDQDMEYLRNLDQKLYSKVDSKV